MRTSNRGGNPASNRVDGVQQECQTGRGDADVLHHDGEIIAGHIIPGELAEPGHGDGKHETVQSSARTEETPDIEASPRRATPDRLQRGNDFLHLDGYERVIRISVSVILDDESACLLVVSMRDLPTRTLR